jgi:FAD/FMN-containing dehydrogenase/Fe-S oxidoreductase
MTGTGTGAFARRLEDALTGEVRFDRYTRGLYSTDASIYQIQPMGVGFPRTAEDVRIAVELAGESGVPITPRGAGTSMSGQSIGTGLVLDTSRHLTRVREFDPDGRRVVVEPGIVLDDLNRLLAPHGLFFPIDVATSSRATIGGMTGNNSAGARSIRYGHMVGQVSGIEAVMADGSTAWFGPSLAGGSRASDAPQAPMALQTALQALYARESEELLRRLPRVPRHVAGYGLHRLGEPGATLADVLVGSEGTLAFFTAIELRLHELPRSRVLAVVRFESVREALSAVPAIVGLDPTAVELVDQALLDLTEKNPGFRPTLMSALGRDAADASDGGLPGAVLLVEFSGDDHDDARARLDALHDVAGEAGARGIVRAEEPDLQAAIWGVRKAGLNIATSMRDPRKPIAFIEDCAIPISRLPEWYDRLSTVIERNETRAIWYAHASVGCLHVRPALDMKDPEDVRRLREIAREAFAIARDLGGSHSGEHGDGIVRSEFLEEMLGPRLAGTFDEIKTRFDPHRILNPGKIVRPPAMDDRSLFRYGPGYETENEETVLDWSDWNGLPAAVEMCNNNGACRQRAPGVMCPSFRATEDERHSTRGRANALRLVLSGQLGENAWDSHELHEAMDLCLGCKACRRECPTGVDMARMKIEFLARQRAVRGLTMRDRTLAYLPHLARWVSHVPTFANARNHAGPFRRVLDRGLGLSSDRPLPKWAPRPFVAPGRRGSGVKVARHHSGAPRAGRRVALFVDTFSRYFEPEQAYAAIRVLRTSGYSVDIPETTGRPLCCGRTFLNAGLVDEARAEMDRVVETFAPLADHGVPIIGLEPSCLLTLRDELQAVRPGPDSRSVAEHALLFSEFLGTEALDRLPFGDTHDTIAVVHGHCHEKAFGVADHTVRVLEAAPGVQASAIAAGCCGMAGSFGYEEEHADLSRKIGETDLAPAVREAPEAAWIVANGTSCRHQIRDLTGREAHHLAVVMDRLMSDQESEPTSS